MRFAYRLPAVKYSDGDTVVVATADRCGRGYKFLEGGSEAVVEVRLQLVVKPDRHGIQFVLEPVCAHPTPPARPTTVRPSAIKTRSHAGTRERFPRLPEPPTWE